MVQLVCMPRYWNWMFAAADMATRRVADIEAAFKSLACTGKAYKHGMIHTAQTDAKLHHCGEKQGALPACQLVCGHPQHPVRGAGSDSGLGGESSTMPRMWTERSTSALSKEQARLSVQALLARSCTTIRTHHADVVVRNPAATHASHVTREAEYKPARS